MPVWSRPMRPMANTGAVFDNALKDFRSRLTPDEQADFACTSFTDVEATIAGIQKEQLSTRTNRNVKRIRTFLEAAESYMKMIDVFGNSSEYVAFLWGPVKCLLLVSTVNFILATSQAFESPTWPVKFAHSHCHLRFKD